MTGRGLAKAVEGTLQGSGMALLAREKTCHDLEAQRAQKHRELQEAEATVRDHEEACVTLEAQLPKDPLPAMGGEGQLGMAVRGHLSRGVGAAVQDH